MIRDFRLRLDYIHHIIKLLTVISIDTFIMQEKLKERASQLRRKNRSTNLLPYFLIFCTVIACLFFYFRYQETAQQTGSRVSRHAESGALAPTLSPEPVIEQQIGGRLPEADPLPDSTGKSPESLVDAVQAGMTQHKTEPLVLGSADGNEPHAIRATPQDYEIAWASIDNFFEHLDQQPYMKTFQLDASSSIYFSTLIQKILDTPPIVSGETDDLFNILQNTAHFFRIVGSNNILVLKTILSHETSSCEEVLADFYTLTQQPEYLRKNFSLHINDDSLYDYAGFFLTTMGGRLYLFRRDSMLRMVVSYYSILIVEKANHLGKNRHGIDIRPAVDTLINEIENSGSQLKLKEHYLDNLYNIKEKYM